MIERAASVGAFFREMLVQALRVRQVHPSELVESYLVQLLSDLIRPGRQPPDTQDRTLVELLQEADRAQGHDRARRLRELGDAALVWSGVFRDRVLHRGLSLSYYTTVGRGAYRRAGHLHRALRASPIDELCLELADTFEKLSDALDEAATLGVDRSERGLLALLKRSHSLGRPWMYQLLAEEGLLRN